MRASKNLVTVLAVLAGTQAAWAQTAPVNSLSPHLDTLWMALYVLGGVLVALIVWEILDKPRGVRIDAALPVKEIDNDYIDPTKMKFAEPATPVRQAPPPAYTPPQPTAEAPPPRPSAPPPSSASSTSSDDDNPFRKLSKLGGEDDGPLASPRPAPRSEPTGVPVSHAPPQVTSSSIPAESGSSSGGWADLLQRVRAGEPSAEDSGKISTRSMSPPSTEEEAPSSSSAAWESLLKKSVNDLGASPDVTTVASDFAPRSIKLGLGGGGDEEKHPVDPLRLALDNPSSDPEENLPDFVKKATRTIALDLKKGGEQTPPPPMPKTEG